MQATKRQSGSTSAAWIGLALCFLAAAIEGFDIGSMGIAAPKLGPEFNLSKPQLGLALSGLPPQTRDPGRSDSRRRLDSRSD
jgi:hypothetical protein